MQERGAALLVYDGDCGFCTRSVDWIVARWPESVRARVVAGQRLTQGELDSLSLSLSDVQRAAWWITEDGRARGHMAVARALADCEGPLGRLGRSLARRPLCWLGAMVYPVVARYRHLLWRGSMECRIPS